MIGIECIIGNMLFNNPEGLKEYMFGDGGGCIKEKGGLQSRQGYKEERGM